jgi:hypothetical protein
MTHQEGAILSPQDLECQGAVRVLHDRAVIVQTSQVTLQSMGRGEFHTSNRLEKHLNLQIYQSSWTCLASAPPHGPE